MKLTKALQAEVEARVSALIDTADNADVPVLELELSALEDIIGLSADDRCMPIPEEVAEWKSLQREARRQLSALQAKAPPKKEVE